MLPWLIGALATIGVLAIATLVALSRRSWFAVHSSMLFVGMFVASGILATLAARYPLRSVAGSYGRYDGLETLVVEAALFALASQLVVAPERLRALTAIIVLSSAVVAGHALTAALAAGAVTEDVEGATFHGIWRASGILGNANALGALLALVLPMAACLCVSGSRPSRVACGLATLVLTAALVMTLSRSAWLAAVLGVGLLFAIRVLSAARIPAVIGVVSLAGVASWVLFPIHAAAVWSRITDLGLVRDSLGFRLELWRAGIQVATQHPLTGFGFSSFPLVFTPAWIDPSAVIDKPHQFLIETSVNQGVGGVIAVVGIFVSVVTGLLRRCDAVARGIAVGLLAYVLVIQFNFETLPTSLLFWGVSGAATGAWLARHASVGRGAIRIAVGCLVALTILAGGEGTRQALADAIAGAGVKAADGGCFARAIPLLESASAMAPERAEYALLLSWTAKGARDADRSARAQKLADAVAPQPWVVAPRLPDGTDCNPRATTLAPLLTPTQRPSPAGDSGRRGRTSLSAETGAVQPLPHHRTCVLNFARWPGHKTLPRRRHVAASTGEAGTPRTSRNANGRATSITSQIASAFVGSRRSTRSGTANR